MAAIDWSSLSVYVSGRFEGFKGDELNALVLGQGARVAGSFSVANALLTQDLNNPKVAKANAKGMTILTPDQLGAPLEDYLERMKAALALFQTKFASYRKNMVYHLAAGPPADDALVAQIEAEVGFPLPEELRTLMAQFNGLSVIGAELPKSADALQLPDQVLPYAALADMSHKLWTTASPSLAVSAIAIPTWQDIFLRAPNERMTGESPYGAKEKLKIGTLKVDAGAFYERLYPFDLFHYYLGAALYADPIEQNFKVIHATDHWADLTNAHPVSLRVYMESLIAMISHNSGFYEQRIIKPVSKTAWPTYIKNIRGAVYVFVETRTS